MKSKDQILLENAYARTYGIRKVKDSEVEQMIEDLNKIQSQVSVMHHGQLTNLKQHLESVVGKIDGRLTSSKATKDVADKHGVSVEQIEAQLEKGIKVEMEHTSNEESARKIALDHLAEVPDYYDKLKEVEGK
jgi:conjugal transfer/entry exclusion protein